MKTGAGRGAQTKDGWWGLGLGAPVTGSSAMGACLPASAGTQLLCALLACFVLCCVVLCSVCSADPFLRRCRSDDGVPHPPAALCPHNPQSGRRLAALEGADRGDS